MIRKTITLLLLLGALWVMPPLTMSTGSAAAQAPAQSTVPNWFNPSAWMAMPGAGAMPAMPGAPLQLNLARPGGWSVFMRPSTWLT